MSACLAALAAPGEGLSLFIVLLFFFLPAVIRLLRYLLERAGAIPPEQKAGPTDLTERRRRAREAQRRLEEAGGDLWRRLARGEDLAAPRAERPSAVPPRRPESVVPTAASAPTRRPSEPLVPVREGERTPATLAVPGGVGEPGEMSVLSMESEGERKPLGQLGTGPRAAPPSPLRRTRLGLSDWRRAVLLSELLGPPVSERPSPFYGP